MKIKTVQLLPFAWLTLSKERFKKKMNDFLFHGLNWWKCHPLPRPARATYQVGGLFSGRAASSREYELGNCIIVMKIKSENQTVLQLPFAWLTLSKEQFKQEMNDFLITDLNW